MNDNKPDGARIQRQRPTYRRAWLITSIVAAAVLALLGGLAGASAAPQQRIDREQPAAAVPPGWRPDVQRWFKAREQLQINLNNTLIIVARQTSLSAEANTACRRLADITLRLQKSERSPVPKLDVPAGAGIEQFSQAARACLSGDFPRMRRQITDGVERRATAQDNVDEILEGEK